MTFYSCLCWLLITILPLFFSPAFANSITLALTRRPPPTNGDSLVDRISVMATASINRARYLKKHHPPGGSAAAPLFPSYGAHSVTLSFGTPPQPLDFFMDTGSPFTWFPCGEHYQCSFCHVDDPKKIPTFKPKLSSTSRIATCGKLSQNISKGCHACWEQPTTTCDKSPLHYRYIYGSAKTAGVYLLESLTLSTETGRMTESGYLVGCSNIACGVPEGIVGFGRHSQQSLPGQLGINSFSYCLISHKYEDNRSVSSNLVLNWGDPPVTNKSIQYTPFVDNPNKTNLAFQTYYYVNLLAISIGNISVSIPQKSLGFDTEGNGGTMVDSGTTLTFMVEEVFSPVADELVKQMGIKNYSRSMEWEEASGLGPCFTAPPNAKKHELPQLAFIFDGGAKMVLPHEDSFILFENSGICATVMTAEEAESSVGPSIIFGNYMHQNFQMVFDLQNNRLGFYEKDCTQD